jgi:hypothetical protein
MKARLALLVAFGAVLGIHGALLLHFEPPALVLGRAPIALLDFDTHYEQTKRAVEASRRSGRLWGYDPHLLAGMPAGAIFDADNKLIELCAVGLDRVGVPPHRAFNLFIWLVHALVPLTLYGAARLLRLGRAAATLAAGLGSMLWFFDSLSHWCFFVGMIAWSSAAYLWLLPLALFYRWLDERRWWQLGGVLGLLVLLLHLHPYTFFMLAVPMGLLYVRARRRLGRRGHVAVWAVVAAVLAANLWWIWPAVRLWHYVLDSGFYLDATPAFLFYDLFGLLKEPDVQGVVSVRTAWRFLALGGAAIGLWCWRRERDDRFAPIGAAFGALLVTAYFGRWVPPLRQIQPYRYVLPAAYLAILPAAWWIARAVERARQSRPSPAALGLGALLALLAVPRLVRDALYFLPGWVPRIERPMPAAPPNVNGPLALGLMWWPEPLDFRHRPIDAVETALSEFVRRHDDGSGRWLVEWWSWGERLAWSTDAQILGGFREINLAHSDANLFRRFPKGMPSDPGGLGGYLERYNVRWLIMSNPMPQIEVRRDLLEPVTTLGTSRVYRTRIAASWMLDGGPGEVRAEIDRLRVRGSRGGELVLKYHYLETLVCRPACTLYRASVLGDRVGFIGVRGAPADFEIVNP